MLIVSGHLWLGSGLFVLWVGALLLAANALQLLLDAPAGLRLPHWTVAVRRRLCPGRAGWRRPHDGGTAEPPEADAVGRVCEACALPAALEGELNALQAQLTALEDQFATEQAERRPG